MSCPGFNSPSSYVFFLCLFVSFLRIFCATFLVIHFYCMNLNLAIKTHGSVSCGPRSRRITPVSILTGRKKTQIHTSVALCFLDETRQFLLWTCHPTSALHIPNLSKIASHVPEIFHFKNWLSYFIFFLLLLIFLPLVAHLQKLL